MEPGALVRHLRCGVLAVRQCGTIVRCEGAIDGLMGHRPDELVGRSVLEFVAPHDVDTIAEIFASGDDDLPILRTPNPFSISLLTGEGEVEVVDVVPSGVVDEDFSGWVMTLTPRSVQPVPHALVDTIVNGGTSVDALRCVVDRFTLQTGDGLRSRAFGLLADADDSGGRVIGSPRDGLWEVLAAEVADREPSRWVDLGPDGLVEVSIEDLPTPVAAAARRDGFTGGQVGVVHAGDLWSGMVWFVNSLELGGMRGNAAMIRRSVMRLLSLVLQRDRAEETLRYAAFHDPLTGLANRSGLHHAIDGLTGSQPVAVLYVDVDDFKVVNDQHGHRVGDLVLGEVADRLRAACRPGDVVARMGGDEFAALLIGVDRVGAVAVAERIVEWVGRRLTVGGGPNTVHVTVGLAGPRPREQFTDLMDEADRAMLTGKSRRRGATGQLVVAGR